MDELRVSAEVARDHPCLAGHFPGRPVVPAVVLLQLVLDALRTWRGAHCQLRELIGAKFLVPLLPGERVDIVLQAAGSRLSFRFERGDALLAQGSCEITC